MRLTDTSRGALAVQLASFRRMTPAQRLALASEMSEEVRALAEAGIRQRHPAYSQSEVRAALAEMILGIEPAAQARSKPASDAK